MPNQSLLSSGTILYGFTMSVCLSVCLSVRLSVCPHDISELLGPISTKLGMQVPTIISSTVANFHQDRSMGSKVMKVTSSEAIQYKL